MDTPGTMAGSGFCDQTLAVKSRKKAKKSFSFCKKIKEAGAELCQAHDKLELVIQGDHY